IAAPTAISTTPMICMNARGETGSADAMTGARYPGQSASRPTNLSSPARKAASPSPIRRAIRAASRRGGKFACVITGLPPPIWRERPVDGSREPFGTSRLHRRRRVDVLPMMQIAESAAHAPTDDAVIARVLAGDRGSFEVLMRRYNRRVYRAARAVV